MLKPKKALGQNFFVNENLGNTLVEYVKNNNPEVIVEIGSGQGFFTKKLNSITSSLVLIEKDDEFSKNLQNEYPNAEVINTDFLEWDFSELEKYSDKRIIFFGSLPYNVSKPIIHRILSSKYFKNPSFFIIQKEVAEKYTAKEPDNNIISLRSQLFANSKKLLDIGAGSFIPRPKVTSSYITFVPNNRKDDINHDKFIKFLELSFRTPRKTLKNNLGPVNLESIDNTLLQKRPSELSLDQYISIFTNLR